MEAPDSPRAEEGGSRASDDADPTSTTTPRGRPGAEGEGGGEKQRKAEEEEEEQGQQQQKEEEEEDSSDNTGDDDDVDPRVEENLEEMNQSCAEVNRLENELDEARSKYRSTFQASSQRMEELGSKIRKSIQRARQYFELSEKAKQAQNEAVRAARQYQSANGHYRAAKEMITLAEQGFDDSSSKTRSLSSAWQETLNHATVRVMEYEREKTRCEAEHNKRAAIFAQLEKQLHFLEKKYKRSIGKARPYFEAKAELELKLQQLKQNIWDLQQTISIRKSRYSEAMRRLEVVSMEIHESRRTRQRLLLNFPREPGVGAETDSLGSSISDVNIERGIFPSTASYEDDPDFDDDDEDDDEDHEDAGDLHPAHHHDRRGCRARSHSRTSRHSQQGTDDSRSYGSASDSVFSSEGQCDSVPQSPAEAPALPVLPFPPGPSPAAVAAARPATRLLDLARGQPQQDLAADSRPGTAAHGGEEQHKRCVDLVGGGAAEQGGGGGVRGTPPSWPRPSQDRREAGDGSAHEDCPQEESFLKAEDLQSLPYKDDVKPASDLWSVAGEAVAAGPEAGQTDVAAGAVSRTDVKKQPLRRTDASSHKALQGVMLLNPSDLVSSTSALRF